MALTGDWTTVKVLGDEQVAHQKKSRRGIIKGKLKKLDDYKDAVRAYRQLSVVLRNQGLNEDAAHFSYCAQLLQRRCFWLQGGIRSFGQYLSSLLLDLLAGYGYKPWRSFLAYHGRGFFPGGIGLDNPLTVFATFEAFVGLLIEVTFIATLTQRLFGK